MKRHLREKELVLHEKLKTYERTRALHRENRRRKDLPTVGIVGYTNAGKSHLFNTLTRKGVLSEDKLFATLGTSVGRIWIHHEVSPDGSFQGKEILLNDTIGFIRDLPPDLIAAFRSTLEDSIMSELLLHVIDVSDTSFREKMVLVEETLSQIGAKQKQFYIFNKIDKLSPLEKQLLEEEFQAENVFFLSAQSGEGIDVLKEKLGICFATES
jgi:GTP-binding protein HflX